MKGSEYDREMLNKLNDKSEENLRKVVLKDKDFDTEEGSVKINP